MTDRRFVKDADFMALGDIRRVQAHNWQIQWEYVVAMSEFYRRQSINATIPESLDALKDFPFTDKEMLREEQRLYPPFGRYLTAQSENIARIHRTSGTTGVAMNLALSESDALMTAQVGARAQRAAGLGPGHRVVHCLNYQLWMGGFTDHAILEATGASVVPFGVGNSSSLIRVIQELGITAISCTPSYPAVLERTIEQMEGNLKPLDLGLKLGLFGGEAGLDQPAFRKALESTWGFKARNANYGVTDILCNFAGQTELSTDLHFVALDVLYPELIDPETGSPLPWRAGERGELVITHLAKDCQPLVRFKTGDIIELTAIDKAPCGRTAPRFRVVGRADDMVVVRGLNLFPAMIQGVLSRIDDLTGQWRVVLDSPPPYDYLPLEVELKSTVESPDNLSGYIAAQIKDQLGATARVSLLPSGSLPLTEGKTRHIHRSYL